MACKSVLLSYMDRNKVIKVPETTTGDIAYLEHEFRKQFLSDNECSAINGTERMTRAMRE